MKQTAGHKENNECMHMHCKDKHCEHCEHGKCMNPHCKDCEHGKCDICMPKKDK